LHSTALTKYKSELIQGIQAGISIAIGYFPVAIAFGLLAERTGLSIAETVMMSAIVFAGAAQYMSLSLIAAHVGAWEIIMTTFIVNIRHFLMSASLNEKVEKDSIWKKALYGFGVTDETYAVAAVRQEMVTAPYMFGLCSMAYSSWVINSGIGYIVGENLPAFLQESMGIALYALFIGLLVPSLKKHRKIIVLALLSAVINSVLLTTGRLSIGWSIALSSLFSSVVVECIFRKLEVQQDE